MNAQQTTAIQRRAFLKGTAAAVSLAGLGIADKVLPSKPPDEPSIADQHERLDLFYRGTAHAKLFRLFSVLSIEEIESIEEFCTKPNVCPSDYHMLKGKAVLAMRLAVQVCQDEGIW